jgi:hypothetical protein
VVIVPSPSTIGTNHVDQVYSAGSEKIKEAGDSHHSRKAVCEIENSQEESSYNGYRWSS